MSNNQVLKEIRNLRESVSEMKDELEMLKERFDDFYLSEAERKALKESLELKKKNKLLTHKEVFE